MKYLFPNMNKTFKSFSAQPYSGRFYILVAVSIRIIIPKEVYLSRGIERAIEQSQIKCALDGGMQSNDCKLRKKK